jgi:acyl-CoA dehydrogenase
MVFKDCRIPRDHLLGLNEEIPKKGSGGFRGVMKTFNMTRPSTAALGIGIAQAALDFCKDEFAKQGIEVDWDAGPQARSAVQQELIELEADLDAAMLTVLHAVRLGDLGQPNNLEASISKAKGGEVARTVTQRCIELLGSLGISRDYLVEKWFRDCRITDIYEGTGQIQRQLGTTRATLPLPTLVALTSRRPGGPSPSGRLAICRRPGLRDRTGSRGRCAGRPRARHRE